MACELPQLPPSIDYFSPNYLAKGHLEASGRFISSNLIWSLEVSKQFCIRLIAEPKNHALEVLLTKDSADIFTRKSPNLGAASFAGKLEPGSYQLELIMDETATESGSNYIDCELPNLYLSIGITPYSNIQQYRSKKYSNIFPDMSEVDENLKETVPYSSTYENSSLDPSQITEPVLVSYIITVPKLAPGTAGFWLYWAMGAKFFLA